MSNKSFILQRICIYVGSQIDPDSDAQVKEALRNLGVKLPQKRTLDESLAATNSDCEVVNLIAKYRSLD